jgi:hypothetical protein
LIPYSYHPPFPVKQVRGLFYHFSYANKYKKEASVKVKPV